MKYFLDTEFHEYHKQQKCLGVKVGKPIPTIDLISIGVVCEDKYTGKIDTKGSIATVTRGEKYYAISKDFNVKDAWNSWQYQYTNGYKFKENSKNKTKVYWLRENVLKPIFIELAMKYYKELPYTDYRVINAIFSDAAMTTFDIVEKYLFKFTLKNFTKLINKYGKTNKQIAEEIKAFVYKGSESSHNIDNWGKNIPFEFYAYYADYDWVVFSQLYGKMIDLPEGYPKYCKDLKQMLDDVKLPITYTETFIPVTMFKHKIPTMEGEIKVIEDHPDYPKQSNEHNALDDAEWNKRLYEFIKQL